MSLTIEIEDWYDLHHGFTLHLSPGFTALVGPNGAGKTTLLQQIKEFAENERIDVWEYSNLRNGGDMARDMYLSCGNITNFATSMVASEGEQVAFNFSNRVGNLGDTIRRHTKEQRPLIVLLDAIDSGASIDRARELRILFSMIEEKELSGGAEIYIVMAVNHYELAKYPVDCVNVRNGSHVKFDSYDEYADFVCSFLENTKGV